MPLKLSGTPGGVRLPAPRLSQHTAALLRHLGYDEATMAQYHADGTV